MKDCSADIKTLTDYKYKQQQLGAANKPFVQA